jgi:hypothetical protein
MTTQSTILPLSKLASTIVCTTTGIFIVRIKLRVLAIEKIPSLL